MAVNGTHFTGCQKYLDGAIAGIDQASGGTVCGWFKYSAAPFPAYETIFQPVASDGSAQYYIQSQDASFVLSIYWDPGTGFTSVVTGLDLRAPPDGVAGEWFYFALVYEAGAGDAKYYISTDGATFGITGTITALPGSWALTGSYIGANQFGEPLEGDIQHFRIFNSPLTVPQITAEMQSPTAILSAIVATELNEGSPVDSSGNGHDVIGTGTLTAATTSAPTIDPVVVQGTSIALGCEG